MNQIHILLWRSREGLQGSRVGSDPPSFDSNWRFCWHHRWFKSFWSWLHTEIQQTSSSLRLRLVGHVIVCFPVVRMQKKGGGKRKSRLSSQIMKYPTKVELIMTEVTPSVETRSTSLGSSSRTWQQMPFLLPRRSDPFLNNKSTKARGRTANVALCLLSLVSFCISICCIKTMKISSPAFCFQQQSTAALMQMTRAGITGVNRISSPLMSSAPSGALLWLHQHRRVTHTEFPGLIVGENLPRLVVAFILKFSEQRRRSPRRSWRPADLTTLTFSPLILSPVDRLGHFRPRWDEGLYVRSRKWLLFHACGTKTAARIHPLLPTGGVADQGRRSGSLKVNQDPSACHRWFSPSSESVLTQRRGAASSGPPLR